MKQIRVKKSQKWFLTPPHFTNLYNKKASCIQEICFKPFLFYPVCTKLNKISPLSRDLPRWNQSSIRIWLFFHFNDSGESAKIIQFSCQSWMIARIVKCIIPRRIDKNLTHCFGASLMTSRFKDVHNNQLYRLNQRFSN